MPLWLITASKSNQQCCPQAYSRLLLTRSCKAEFIQNRKLSVFITVQSGLFSYISSLVESLTRIRPREAPFPLYISRNGTLGRFHKGYNINCMITVFPHHMGFGVWCHPVDICELCCCQTSVTWGPSLVWPSAAKSICNKHLQVWHRRTCLVAWSPKCTITLTW